MRVRDIMTREVVELPAETGCPEALAALDQRGLTCVVVTSPDGPPGLVSHQVLAQAAGRRHGSQPPPDLGSLSRGPAPSVRPGVPLGIATELMQQHDRRHLLVIDDGTIAGTISRADITRTLDLLRGHRILAGLDQSSTMLLLRIASYQTADADTVLLAEGEEDANLYVLVRGGLSVYTRQAGRIARIRPGEMIGELEIFGGRNAATVRVTEHSQLLVIERARLLVLLAGNPTMAATIYSNISELLGDRLRRANRFIFLRGIARQRKLIFRILAGTGLVLVLFTMGFGVASENPTFCTSCHYMQPYYDSWTLSSHKHVRCVKCHYSYGFRGVLRGKITGLAMVTRYVTRTYDPKPEAEVSDSSCIRGGCHGRLPDTQVMASLPNIRFAHQAHRDSTGIGARLRCTSCHQHTRQSAHFSVTRDACYLCHFMNKQPAQLETGCRACHLFDPGAATTRQIDHDALPERTACLNCHEAMVEGDGRVEPFRCYSCHLKVKDVPAAELHRIHIAERDVACFECHAQLNHRSGGGLILAQRCSSCHPDQHTSQEQVYLGRGGRDVIETPGIMSYFHVECTGCHRPAAGGTAGAQPAGGGTVVPAVPATEAHRRGKVTEAACLSCHDLSYREKLQMWRTTIDSAVATTEQALRRAERALAASPGAAGDDPARVQARAEARQLYEDAAYNYQLVATDNSRGVHNFKYTRDLLQAAQLKLKRAIERLGR